jgi:hypothetical protein
MTIDLFGGHCILKGFNRNGPETTNLELFIYKVYFLNLGPSSLFNITFDFDFQRLRSFGL